MRAATAVLAVVLAVPVFAADREVQSPTPHSALGARPAKPGDISVILIEDNFIYIRAGKDVGVQVGDLFSVTRPGRAIVDPSTGDTLGYEPVAIAKLRVYYAAPHYSRAAALEVVKDMPVQIGDRVVRWDGEVVGRIPAPVVVDLEDEEPARSKTQAGDRIFIDKKRRTGEVVGDFELDAEIIDYDFGDIDGDGVPELAALEEHKVSLYRTIGGALESFWSETLDGFRYINLELFDADGDGSVELFVSRKEGNVSRTAVFSYQNGQVTKSGEIKNYFVRQSGDALYAQRFGFAKPFVGPTVEVTYSPADNRLTKVRDVYEGSPQANCLGMGIGKNRLAYLDHNDRLNITDRSGSPVWRGTKALGGSTQNLESGNGKEKIKIQKKIMFDDFDGDGTEDLLVVQNELNPLWGMTGVFGGLRFKNGKFLIFSDRPGGYDVLKETREFEGYVSDYEYTRVGGPDKQLSLCLVISAGREKFKSRIIVLRQL
ncbi:hypothetical protein HY522_09570 [bacterium]|nr:hypothetical protein [bacterium]